MRNDAFRSLDIGLPEDILRRKIYGDFAGAQRLIALRLSDPDLPQALRNCLTVQGEIIRRLPEEYPYTRVQALEVLRAHIPDFSEDEFDLRVDRREISWIYVDGVPRFFGRFFDTLCKAEPAFAARAGMTLPGAESASKGSETEDRLNRRVRRMKEQGKLTCRIRIRASLQLKEEAFTPGMFVQAHLPIPVPCSQQKEITLERVFPPEGCPAPEDALQRTLCWEETMVENHPFEVEYSYLHTEVFHDLEAVSYTHLDVYKRQVVLRPGQLPAGIPEQPPLDLQKLHPAVLTAEETEQAVEGGQHRVDGGGGIPRRLEMGLPARRGLLRHRPALQPPDKGPYVPQVFLDRPPAPLLLVQMPGKGRDL